MTQFYFPSHRWALVVALLLSCGLSGAWAASAPIYTHSGPTGFQFNRACTTIGSFPVEITTCLGSISKPELATDTDFNSAATLKVPLSVAASSVRFRLDLTAKAPANYRAGLVVERQGDLLASLGVKAAGLLVVRTYLKTSAGTTLQEEKPVSAEVVDALFSSVTGKVRVEFLAKKEFNQIELEAATLASLAYDLNIYYGYALDANVIDTAQGLVSRFAQPSTANYSTSVVTNGVTVCVNSNVTNPLNAVDNNLTNYATLGSLADVSCPLTLKTQLEATAPAGYHAGFLLGSAGLLDATVLDGLTVTTYLGGVRQETATGASLLDLNVLPNQQYNVNFATTKSFDRVEIQRTGLASVLDNLQVYYGFGLEPRVFEDQTPHLSKFTSPVGNYQVSITNPLLCVGCSVTAPESATDNNLATNYATIRTPLAVGGTTRLKLRLDGPGLAGNVAGAVLGLGAGLLDASVLAGIRINTYAGPTGTELVESGIGGALLNVELLANGQQEISFLTTRDFQWVEVEISSGISALTNTQVYYGFAEDRPVGFPSTITRPSGPLPVQLVAFTAKVSGAAVQLNWHTATELQSSHFVVERALGGTTDFRPIGRVGAAGTSSNTRYYALRDAEAASLQAPTLYYRLRQVDADGKEAFSSVAVVALEAQPAALTLYPNPATGTDEIRAQLYSLPAGTYQVTMYNLQGSQVHQQAISSPLAVLTPTSLGAGLYQVVVRNAAGEQVAAQRLVVSGR